MVEAIEQREPGKDVAAQLRIHPGEFAPIFRPLLARRLIDEAARVLTYQRDQELVAVLIAADQVEPVI